MIRSRFKKIVLVAGDAFPGQLIAGYKNVRHVHAISNLFPTIHEFTPDLVIFDYEFAGSDLEKILRRITANKFYHKITVHCFKNERSTKTDGLLSVLGVNQFIYRESLLKDKKDHGMFNAVNTMIDQSVIHLVTSVSN